MPCSRWSHFITQIRGDTKSAEDGFLMFGGANLKAYCRTTLWNFHLPKITATKTSAPI